MTRIREPPPTAVPDPFPDRGPEGRGAPGRETIPAEDDLPLHVIVVALVLGLDALLVAVAPPGFTGVSSNGATVYLVLPAAAALYMALAWLASASVQRAVGTRRPALLSALALGIALVLLGLVVTSAAPSEAAAIRPVLPWLLAACLAGVSVPVAAFWIVPPARALARSFGLAAAGAPPLLALALRSLLPSSDSAVLVTAVALGASAGLFYLSGALFGRTALRTAVPAPKVPHPTGPSPVALFGARPAGRTSGTPLLAPPTPRSAPSHPVAGTGPTVVPGPTKPRMPGRWPDVISTGFAWLDDFFLGGFPRRGQLALLDDSGLASTAVMLGTLAAAIRRGEPVVIVTASARVSEVAQRLDRLNPGVLDGGRDRLIRWVDASGRKVPLGTAQVPNPLDRSEAVRVLTDIGAATRDAERASPRGFCLAFLGVASMARRVGDEAIATFLRNLVGILRERPANATYQFELGPQVPVGLRTALAEFDGMLLFRSVSGRPSLKVFQISPVASREWVECDFPGLRAPAESPALAPAPGAWSPTT